MTCDLALSPNPLSACAPWFSTESSPLHPLRPGLERAQFNGYTSSSVELKPGSSIKKRASRAGTRSVKTLSAAQLAHKRANDREAQRAIRQRTKNRIEGLEKSILELHQILDAWKESASVMQQRNMELEEEVSHLRLRLYEAIGAVRFPLLCAYLPLWKLASVTGSDHSLTFTGILLTLFLAPHSQESSPRSAHVATPGTQASESSIPRSKPLSTSRSFPETHRNDFRSSSPQHQRLSSWSCTGAWNPTDAISGHTPAQRPQWPPTTPHYQHTIADQQSQLLLAPVGSYGGWSGCISFDYWHFVGDQGGRQQVASMLLESGMPEVSASVDL